MNAGYDDGPGVIMPVRLMPRDAAPGGFVHPGELLRQVDLAGAMAAMRHCRTAVVTVSLDRMDFLAPCSVGEVAILRARVNATGRSSMEVGVRVDAENPATGEVRHAATAYLTYVSVGENRQPRSVPPAVIETGDDRRREIEASARRDMRREERARERAAQDGDVPAGDAHERAADSGVIMPARVMPRDANPAGNVHGGVTLDRIVQAATMAAMGHCRSAVALGSVSRVDFLDPGKVDDVMTFKARVNCAEESGMEIGVRVEAENLLTGMARHAATAYLSFVPLDGDGRPVPPPPFKPCTPVELRRREEALQRMEARHAERAREGGSQA